MPELLAALDAFLQENRRCGELDGGVDGERVWMACDCGAGIARSRPTWAGATLKWLKVKQPEYRVEERGWSTRK